MKNWICMILSLALLLSVGFSGTACAEDVCEEGTMSEVQETDEEAIAEEQGNCVEEMAAEEEEINVLGLVPQNELCLDIDLTYEYIPGPEHVFVLDPSVLEDYRNRYSPTPCENEHSMTEQIISPSCEYGGHTAHICSVCGYCYYDNPTPSTGHIFSEWTVIEEGTCVKAGRESRICTGCGAQEIYSTSKDRNNHQLTEDTVPATCESGGYTVHTCSDCGYSYTDNETPPAEHSFGDWSTVSEPDCANEGNEVRTCTVCGAQENRSIPASGDHQMTEDTVPATCESGGYTIHTCSVCGYSYTDNKTPALGHSFGSWKMTTAPTCAADDEQTRTCTRCSQTETQAYPATGVHNFSKSVTKANCLREGYTTYTCRRCGYSYTADETPKTEHKMGSWKTSKIANCQQDGVETRKCICCSYTETRTVSGKTDHNYQTQTVKPTCQTEGYTEHVCKVCGDSYRDSVTEKTDHNFGNWYTVTNPTCAKVGTERRSCRMCGLAETRDVPKTENHVYSNRVVAPTCQTEGYTEHVCKNCGKTYTDSKTATVGHNYVASLVYADCNNEGYTLHKCSVCGDEYRDTYTPKTTHLYRCTETSATCQHAGVQTWTCFWCGDSYKVNAPVQPHSYSVSVFNEATRDSHGEAHSECQWCGEKVNSRVTHYYVPTASCKPSGSDPGYTTFTCTICGDSYNTSKYNEKIDYGLQIAKSDKSQEEKLRDIFAASEFYLGNCVIGSGNIYNMCNACGIECKIVSIHNPEQQARFGYTEEDIAYMNQTGFYPNGIGRDHHWVVCTIDGKTYEYGL